MQNKYFYKQFNTYKNYYNITAKPDIYVLLELKKKFLEIHKDVKPNFFVEVVNFFNKVSLEQKTTILRNTDYKKFDVNKLKYFAFAVENQLRKTKQEIELIKQRKNSNRIKGVILNALNKKGIEVFIRYSPHVNLLDGDGYLDVKYKNLYEITLANKKLINPLLWDSSKKLLISIF